MGKNKPLCLINQPAGLGDILLCQKIACHLVNLGYEVIWPVVDYYNFITEYIKTPGITFYNVKDDFPYKDIFLQDKIDQSEYFSLIS